MINGDFNTSIACVAPFSKAVAMFAKGVPLVIERQ